MTGKKIVAVVEDLFFIVKINDAAKRAGLAVTYVKTDEDALSQAVDAKLVIIDLNILSLQPIALIQRLKAEAPGVSLLGYVSHVQSELKQKAQAAGCNVVLAKSALSTNLQQILKRHASLIA
jgi:DNA-binding NarL/FixJ family response regulator